MKKCPVCGYTEEQDQSILIPDRGEKAQHSIDSIKRIMVDHKLASEKDFTTFLVSIRDADDLVVCSMIDRFFKSGLYINKPLAYLAAMINNSDSKSSTLREIEEKMYGKKPVYRELK